MTDAEFEALMTADNFNPLQKEMARLQRQFIMRCTEKPEYPCIVAEALGAAIALEYEREGAEELMKIAYEHMLTGWKQMCQTADGHKNKLN